MKPGLALFVSEDGGTCHCGQLGGGTFTRSHPPSSTTPSQSAEGHVSPYAHLRGLSEAEGELDNPPTIDHPSPRIEPKRAGATLIDVDASSIGTAVTPPRLVEAAAAGDADAFRRLVEPYLETALRASILVVGSESEAADAVQDALLSAWQRLAKLRDPQVFPAWFRTIVMRAAMRHARSRPRVVALDLDAPTQAGALDRSIETRQLSRAFATLSPDDRVALTLRHLWSVSTRESAGLLGVPEGTVKSRTFHALERLRAAYAAEERR